MGKKDKMAREFLGSTQTQSRKEEDINNRNIDKISRSAQAQHKIVSIKAVMRKRGNMSPSWSGASAK